MWLLWMWHKLRFSSQLVKKPFLSALKGKLQYGRRSSSCPAGFCSKSLCLSCHHIMCGGSLAVAREADCEESNLCCTPAFMLTRANVVKGICILPGQCSHTLNCENRDHEDPRGVLWEEPGLEWSGHHSLILSNISCKGTWGCIRPSWAAAAEGKL